MLKFCSPKSSRSSFQKRLAERQPSVENFYQKAEDVITQPLLSELELDVRLKNKLTERELSKLLQSKKPLIIALSSEFSNEKKQLLDSQIQIQDPTTSAEIEDRQLNRAVFNIGDSTLGDSVITETFVNEASSGNKNSLKTGSANTKDATVSAAENSAATPTPTPTTTTQSIETTRTNESVSENVRDVSEQRSKSTESATEVVESISHQSSHFSSSKKDYSSKVIVQSDVDQNGSLRSVTNSNKSVEDSPTVLVHHISNEEDPSLHTPKSQVITHSEEQSSSSSSSHRATKNGVDLSKKTSTKAAESSTTQTLSFSNVRGQPSSSQIIYEPRKLMFDNFASDSGPSRAIIHQISREDGFDNIKQGNSKVIVHQISREENQRSSTSHESVITQHILPQTTDYKSIVHQISPTSPNGRKRSESETPYESDRVFDHSSHQQSFSQDRFSQNVFKNDIIPTSTKETQSEPLDKNKKVILIPILQENSTQTSPLPSLSQDNPLHSNLLELIKDENNSETRSSKQSEGCRQTSSSPLSRSPVICFENLSKSFELNKNIPEDSSKSIDTSDGSKPTSAENSPKVIEHSIRQDGSTQKNTKKSDDLEPLRIPSFPINRPSKVIVHPIINETSGKPVFPYSEKSLKTIDTSSKKIASEILKEVSSELLKSSFILQRTKEELEKDHPEPIMTSFPVSLKNQASFRPGFFETNKFEKQTNPLDSEAKVVVHKISKNTSESESKSKSVEEKVIVHQISRDESNDSSNFITNSHFNSSPSSFPISAEKEAHASQYTSRPQDSQLKTIDLQSLRDSAKLHQTSSSMNSTFTETENRKEIIHEILKDSTSTSPASKKVSNEPKVIHHEISKENSTLQRSPSFPLVKEHNETPSSQKNSANLKDSFPLSSLKIQHPDQYNSKSTVLEQKTINIERLRNESKLIQSSTSPFEQKLMEERAEQKKIPQSPQAPAQESSFPVSEIKQKQTSFTSQHNSKPSNFPISVEQETHATQYTARPQDSQSKSIDLQSLRNSAEFRQSSSTMTSTYGLTEIENKKEIIHEILKESSSNDTSSSTNSKSQNLQTKQDSSELLQSSSTQSSTEKTKNKDERKEIVHQILREQSSSDLQQPQTPNQQSSSTKATDESPIPKEIIHQIVRDDSSSDVPPLTLDHQTSQDESISSSEGSVLTAIHNESPRSISPPTAEETKPKESSEDKSSKRSFFLAPIELPNNVQSDTVEVKQDLQIISPDSVKVITHPVVVRQIEKPLGYRVESPQPEKIPMLMKKSKSFDDDDVVIQEMSDTSSAGDTDNPPVISEAESETDTIEAVDDFPDQPSCSSLVSIQTLPMDHENSDNLSPKATQEYKTRRQQNRAALESHFLPQFLAPNFLDSIKEENSDLSDSDRRSSCSDRVDTSLQQCDLEDDVFLDPPKKANAVYPKSNLDFSKKHKHVLNVRPPNTSVIREECSPPSVVEAKIIDQGSIEESCSSWSTNLTPEAEAAEVVYINSASSSVSDLLELDYSQGHPDDSADVRIQTPTIDLDSVNEMFATCQQIESNDRQTFIPPTEKPPPPPPVNDSVQENNINERNLSPSHNKNDLPDTAKLKLENDHKQEKCKIENEIIFEKIETMSEKAGDTLKSSDDVSATGTLVSAENSIANNSNSCDSAIDQIVTSNTSPSPSVSANANVNAAAAVVGLNKNMENIREIVNASSSSASSKSELDSKTITDRTSTDHGFLKTNFMIGQPCSDHTLKCDTKSSSLSSSSSACSSSSTTTNTTTTTTTKILTLHDLSQALDSTKHLINPLVSPSSSALDRQESLDSHGSDQSHSTNQSQCTAINQGSLPHCDWNELDTTTDSTYVSESDTAAGLASSEASSPSTTKGAHTSADKTESPPIRKLRSLCTEALASMPYGEEVLQELATVAQNIRDMPYPLPDLPQIQDIQLSLGANAKPTKPEKKSVITLSQVPPRPGAAQMGQKFKSPPPPPVPEPPSKYDSWLGVPTESDPSVLVCLSPSQRNAVKSDSTADSLLDMHKKFVERRGYHEYTAKQVNAINQANSAEATKLSKVDSPPPPPLPPRPPTQLSNPNGNTDINENDDEEDQNNHRLLAIIRDTHQSQPQQQQQQHQHNSSMTSTSENISRRTESGIHKTVSTTKDGTSSAHRETEFSNTPCSVNNQSQERKFTSENSKSHVGEMQQSESEHSMKVGGESVMGMKFPTSEYFDSIFAAGKEKRFSNIEIGSRPEFCSQLLSTQPKRYSNIETSSFESKKCVENGKVLYDVCDSKREKICEGDQPDSASSASMGPAFFPETPKAKTNGLEGGFPTSSTANRSGTDDSRPKHGGDSENIMSAFKLNTTQTTAPPASSRVESSPPAPPVPPLPPTLTADTTATSSTMTTKSTSTSESHINRTLNATTDEKTFDDFRQRAKEAASTTTSGSGGRNESSSTATVTDKKQSDAFQHEKLFKEFDELSNLLKDELESGKRRPPATLNGNDIPSSVIDYNRVARESKIQSSHVSSTTSTETTRREQMKKLADEIDRTSKQKLQQRREMRVPIIIEKSTEAGPQSAPVYSQEPRSYDIPVRVEGGRPSHPNLQHQRSYEIPVRVEQSSSNSRQRTFSEHQNQTRTHEIPIQVEEPRPDRFRRAESMFNISDSTTASRHHLHHDDWMKYVGDLGSSDNICKPFQREVEICYLGRRPNIRAPRMSASTNDLSSIQTFDTHGAYDVRRTAQTPRPQQPPRRTHLSTQSLIDTTPITSCVSARRSPAPERRSSLPREIHDRQLQYITSKEQQLKYEFERLENERRHLIDEMNRVQMNQRISREAYRQRQLPPLTEDECFRQQMAEEWLNKVAEREERRLQKIIKISKINQEAGVPVAPPRRHSAADDIGDEFLRRVKERRSKLHMPSDSDWESGAESQPLPRTDGSRSENDEPPVTVFEGQSAANIRQLPKHLREFAKLTSQMKEEHRQEMTENTSTSASKTTSQKTTVKMTSNNHTSHESHQSMQQDVAHVRDLEQQLSHNSGKRQKLVTILRHKKPGSTECGTAAGAAGGGAINNNNNNNCQQQQQSASSNNCNTNSAIKRRKQTRFLLTPNRRSWSESDLLREIDKDLVLAKGFLYANGVWTPKNQTPTSSRTNLNESQPQNHNNNNNNNSSSSTNSSPVKERRSENRSSSACGRSQKGIPTPPPPPLWTPQPERKQFRPVHFESPTLQRKYVQQQSTTSSSSEIPSPPWSYTNSQPFPGYQSQSCTNLNHKDTAISWPPQASASASASASSQVVHHQGTTKTRAVFNEVEKNIDDRNDDGVFSPTTSIAEKIRSFERSNSNNELQRPFVRHNPHEKPAILKPNEVIFSVKNEYMSEPETEYDKPKKMAQLSRRQYDGIGPTTKDGMPVVLRSEVKEPNQHEWYKRIFQTIHKQKNPDDYVTIRYKCPRGRYPYKANGYMSEPEPNYDSDYSTVKYRTLERRRLQSTGGTESRTSASGTIGNESRDETFYGTMPNPVKSGQGSYKVQPGRIENYITGHSSVSEKEKKEWWDEVMDIFNGQLDQQKLSPHYTEGNLSRALLKEQGYTSDSNLVFRKKDVPILQSPLSPVEQKQVYKSVQAGGQPPLLGFRKPAPEKPKDDDDVPTPPVPPTKGVPLPLDSNGSYILESPNRYFESDVNIHYKTPIRYEYKDPIPEEELAIRQAETMQKLYQEERRRKYLQELQDMNSRRHTDNFTPSQKSPIPLNRYDDFNSDLAPKSPNNLTNYPRTVARALYNFQGQTARELTFKKGDVIYIRRQIDKNWYEGEHNAMIGLLPSNYVELLTKDGIRQPPKKPSEGQARAKYNFQAQSGIELSLNKGEHVTLTRRVDENWYEGKIANRKGIFPVSYVEVLVDIGAEDKIGGRLTVTQSSSSMRPSLDTLRTNINNEFNSLTSNGQQPPNGILRETRTLHKTEVLHVDTNAEPIPYRALYKYRPQNTDELELHEGDIVLVLEKCDDGWFVGTSDRTGCFGTFPGNYVERV